MLNPVLRAKYTNPGVVNALTCFADECQRNNYDVQVYGTGREFDIEVPCTFLCNVKDIWETFANFYLKPLFAEVESDSESINSFIMSDKYAHESTKKGAVPLWVK